VQTAQTVPSDRPRVTVRLEPEVADKLEALAERERRSKSQMAEILIEEAIKAREEASSDE
jgi:predicted transcriptional regulator